MAKINKRAFKKALKGTRGIITLIAKNLDVERLTVYNYLKKHKKAKELIEQEKEDVVDMAENKLHQALTKGESWAIKTILLQHKKGQNRGYGDKMNLEHSGEVAQNIDKVTVEIIDPQGEKNE